MASLIARHLDLTVEAGVTGGLAAGEWIGPPEPPTGPAHFLHAAVRADDDWRTIDEAPLAPRFDETLTWMDDELLVVGGSDATVPENRTRTWRPRPSPTAPAPPRPPTAGEPIGRNLPGRHIGPEAESGDGLAYVVGGDPDMPGPAAAAYNPPRRQLAGAGVPARGRTHQPHRHVGRRRRLSVYGGSLRYGGRAGGDRLGPF